MRRLDLVPVALLVVLAGAVGVMTVRTGDTATDPPSPVDSAGGGPAMESRAGHAASASLATGPRGRTDVQVEMRRSELRAPDFDREDVLRRLGYGAAGTYVMAMLEQDSGAARWPERSIEPIRVWVEPTSTLRDWRPEYVAMARDAFEHWRAAGIPVRVNHLVDSAGAEVRIVWTDRFDDERIGSTRRFRDQHWWLVESDVTLAVRTSDGVPLPPEVVAALAIHEAGHVLGLNHSPDAADVMATRHHGVHLPSPADLATMRLLYTIPPGRLR